MENCFECIFLSIGGECIEDWFTDNKQRVEDDCPKCKNYNCDLCYWNGKHLDKQYCDECIHNKKK